MRIEQIKITNHSRVKDIDFCVRGNAVIVGANNVGKSSLLRLLNLALSASRGRLYQELTLADLRAPESPLVVDVVFCDFRDVERAGFPGEITIGSVDRSESLLIRLEASSDPEGGPELQIRRWFPEGGHDRGPTGEQLEAIGWNYLPADRGTSSYALEGPKSPLRALLASTELGAELEQLRSYLTDFNNTLASNPKINGLLTTIAEGLSRAMPRSFGVEDLTIRTINDPTGDVLENVTMLIRQVDDLMPIAEQSDGVRQLIAITLFELAQGAANVVAIDEPELHLHPASQRTIASLLADSDSQRLVITHSPYILQRFSPQQVVVISDFEGCRQLPVTHRLSDEIGRKTQVAKELANWWSPGLLEALTARHVVIVEGVSDRIIVEAAARACDLDLDRVGVAILELSGADKFTHVWSLLGKDGFDIPTLCLVDADRKEVWLNAIGGDSAGIIGEILWVSDPDLEGEYCKAITAEKLVAALCRAGVCDEPSLLHAFGAKCVADLPPEQLASYCRKSERKVLCAIAIATELDHTSFSNIGSVASLLRKLRMLSGA